MSKPRLTMPDPVPFPNRPMAGDVLSEIRRRKGLTLREFCLERELEPIRYSMIERDMLYPTREESEHYLALVGPDPRKNRRPRRKA